MTPNLQIKIVERFTNRGGVERLELKPGINLLIGVSNTGKTRWLQMIDFLFGKDRTALELFGETIAEKYTSVAALISIGGTEYRLERQWSNPTLSSQTRVNGEALDDLALSNFFLTELSFPRLKYPKSRSLGEYNWVELTWRVLLRHIYRQEKYWSDLADKQPPPDQHAALLQFLGLAEAVFSPEAHRSNDLRRELFTLVGQKSEFEALISEVAHRVLGEDARTTGITEDLLDITINKLTKELSLLLETRSSIIQTLVQTGSASSKTPESIIDVELGRKRSDLLNRIDYLRQELSAVMKRIKKIESTQILLTSELDRLERTRVSGDILANLKVTHCPVCDQKIDDRPPLPNQCYCCKQSYDYPAAGKRLEFEESQIREEYNEATMLVNSLQQQREKLQRELEHSEVEMRSNENALAPARSRVAAFISPELTVVDANRGKLDERIANATRLKQILHSRRNISSRIDHISQELARLEAAAAAQDIPMRWEQSSDLMSDGLNTYLSQVTVDGKPWNQGIARVKLTERYFRVDIDDVNWNDKLGGTFRCIFLVAYHFALLRLSIEEYCRYPGLTIIDFPPNPTEHLGSNRSLNYLLKPFISLFARQEMKFAQFIAAARDFEPQEGVNAIKLEKQWV